eukprot:scaffold15324_cov38-Phaeocystis_antarctica.AAC.1
MQSSKSRRRRRRPRRTAQTRAAWACPTHPSRHGRLRHFVQRPPLGRSDPSRPAPVGTRAAPPGQGRSHPPVAVPAASCQAAGRRARASAGEGRSALQSRGSARLPARLLARRARKSPVHDRRIAGPSPDGRQLEEVPHDHHQQPTEGHLHAVEERREIQDVRDATARVLQVLAAEEGGLVQDDCEDLLRVAMVLCKSGGRVWPLWSGARVGGRQLRRGHAQPGAQCVAVRQERGRHAHVRQEDDPAEPVAEHDVFKHLQHRRLPRPTRTEEQVHVACYLVSRCVLLGQPWPPLRPGLAANARAPRIKEPRHEPPAELSLALVEWR